MFKSKSEQRRVEAMKLSKDRSFSKNPARNYTAKIKIYRDGAGEYRWRLVGSNGRIFADSAEGYATKYNCEQAIARFRDSAAQATIVESAEELS